MADPVIDLGDVIFVDVVANEGAPPDQVQYQGIRFQWPYGPDGNPIPPPPGFATLRIRGVDLYGYARNVNGQWQWVLQTKPDATTVAVNAIPTGGWTSADARTVYLNTAQYLLAAGVSSGVLGPGLKNLYDAALTDLVAKGWAASPTP